MDNFKHINDTWGHLEGDRALKLIGSTLFDIAKANNSTAFRFGGDEFVIITDKSEEGLSEKICDEVKNALDNLSFRDDFAIRMSMGVALYDGTKTNPTIEGPKVYKRNGYYYIFAPAGGVKFGWQTVLRSKNLYGPYEEKTVMHQGNSDINGPHQGGLVDTPAGEEWFIHFQDAGVYGRITHM
jgi:hypothetical protein